MFILQILLAIMRMSLIISKSECGWLCNEYGATMQNIPARRMTCMSCLEIDAILAFNFEWIELRSFLATARRCIPRNEGCTLTEPDFILALAHNECHAGQQFERALCTMLNRRHRQHVQALREASASHAMALIDQCDDAFPYLGSYGPC